MRWSRVQGSVYRTPTYSHPFASAVTPTKDHQRPSERSHAQYQSAQESSAVLARSLPCFKLRSYPKRASNM